MPALRWNSWSRRPPWGNERRDAARHVLRCAIRKFSGDLNAVAAHARGPAQCQNRITNSPIKQPCFMKNPSSRGSAGVTGTKGPPGGSRRSRAASRDGRQCGGSAKRLSCRPSFRLASRNPTSGLAPPSQAPSSGIRPPCGACLDPQGALAIRHHYCSVRIRIRHSTGVLRFC